MSKTDGKLSQHVKLRSGIDANNAGKSGRQDCVLYVTEGESGACYANKLISFVPTSRDNIGVLPLRGKLLNVLKASPEQIEANKEIAELKKMLGLREDTNYLVDAEYNKLRYGRLMIMADSDVDGKHIISLIVNFFYWRFPSLLSREFVCYYSTPIIRVWPKGNTSIRFYDQCQYEEWQAHNPDSKSVKHKYYKGLGTSRDSDIKEDLSSPRVITFVVDDKTPYYMSLAFDSKNSDKRKKWLKDWQRMPYIVQITHQAVSYFIDQELTSYHFANFNRAIPQLIDGLKDSQRKVLYGAFKIWANGGNKISKNSKDVKVAQFSAQVAQLTNYHHGESNLDGVIIAMTQDFVGSNNLPYFTKEGQYGTRYYNGRDAAEARYLYTKPNPILSYIYRKEDKDLLEQDSDEGDLIEPKYYLPIIPMVLVNGARGIATGYSSYIPCHNPIEIIDWLLKRLSLDEDQSANQSAEVLPDLSRLSLEDLTYPLPWYKGWMGSMVLAPKNQTEKENILPEEEEVPETPEGYEMKNRNKMFQIRGILSML